MDVKIPCPCPGERHPEGDTVTLFDELDTHRSLIVSKGVKLIDNEDTETRGAEVLAVLSEGYVFQGIKSWTLVDERNKALEVNAPNIRERIWSNWSVASEIVEAADDLYSKAILLPLLRKASSSSQPSPTPEPTSVKRSGQERRPRQLRPSSTSSTQTDDTETTTSSLVGDFKPSLSSDTAA